MQNLKAKTILYFFPGSKSSFVAKDIRLLSKHFNIKEYSFKTQNKKLILWELIKQKTFILFNIFSSSIFIIKFGGYWSLIPVIIARAFGKKSIIITGGTDCVSFPQMHYGNFQNKYLGWFTSLSFKYTNRIIALHPSMIKSDYLYHDCSYNQQGLEVHIPNLRTPYSLAYNGYDSEFWEKSNEKQQLSFLTVASGLGEERRRILKGIDSILEIASEFPNYIFTIVGTDSTEIREYPNNVILKPKANAEELIEYYSKAQFYLQLSMSEGFPNSLCEAMLCECVPIVSNVASMPFIIDDSGFVLERKDKNLLRELIQTAIESDTDTLGKKARKRIADNFTEQERERKLIEAIELTIMNK